MPAAASTPTGCRSRCRGRRPGSAASRVVCPSTPVNAGSATAVTERRRAEHHEHPRHRVDPEVEQGAAAELGGVEPVRRIRREVHAQIGGDRRTSPSAPSAIELADAQRVREEAGPHRLHAEHAGGTGGRHDGRRLGGVHRERLLHEHVLARSDRGEGVLGVQRVRGGDVDGVDVRVLDERLVARRAAAGRRRSPRTGPRTPATGTPRRRSARRAGIRRPARRLRRDLPGPHHSPAQRHAADRGTGRRSLRCGCGSVPGSQRRRQRVRHGSTRMSSTSQVPVPVLVMRQRDVLLAVRAGDVARAGSAG